MSAVFPREVSHWEAGDLAYCVSAHVPRECSAKLEVGRIYKVSKAVKPSNIGHHAMRLVGFDWPTQEDYVWSNRFIRLGPVGGRLRLIMNAIEYSPMHYWPLCNPFREGNRHWKKRDAKAIEARTKTP